MSSERTHRHAHPRTRPPRDRGGRCAVSFPALPSPPPLFKSSTKPFIPSFMYAVLLIEELGKHLGGGGAPAGRGTAGFGTRAERTRGQPGFVLSLVRVQRAEKSLPPWGTPANWRRLTPATPHSHQLEREIPIQSSLRSDLVRVGCIASGRVSWSTSGSPHTDKCAVSLWWLLLLGPWGARAARAPHPSTAWRAGGGGCVEETPRRALPHLPAAF